MADKSENPTVSLNLPEQAVAGQPIWCTVSVTNDTKTPLLLNTRMLLNFDGSPGELSLTVRRSGEAALMFRRLVTPRPVEESDFREIQPGESLQYRIDIAELYGVTQPATFEVVATYRNEADGKVKGRAVWIGSVTSLPKMVKVMDVPLDRK